MALEQRVKQLKLASGLRLALVQFYSVILLLQGVFSRHAPRTICAYLGLCILICTFLLYGHECSCNEGETRPYQVHAIVFHETLKTSVLGAFRR